MTEFETLFEYKCFFNPITEE